MNQLQQANGIVNLLTPINTTLREIVQDAQNEPPHGKADGSLSEERWTQLRDLVNAIDTYNKCLLKFRGGR